MGPIGNNKGRRSFVAEINVTPLVDVMLVLLIIFMVTAPLLGGRLPLDLPQTDAPVTTAPSATMQVTLRADGRLYLDEQASTLAALSDRARALASQRPDTEVQLRADQSVPYGRVAELIGAIQQAGLQRVAFVTEAPPETGVRP